jgi:ubiquitin-protein ligase
MIFFLPTPTLLFGRYPLDPPQVYCISQIKTIDIMARGVCGEGGGGILHLVGGRKWRYSSPSLHA